MIKIVKKGILFKKGTGLINHSWKQSFFVLTATGRLYEFDQDYVFLSNDTENASLHSSSNLFASLSRKPTKKNRIAAGGFVKPSDTIILLQSTLSPNFDKETPNEQEFMLLEHHNSLLGRSKTKYIVNCKKLKFESSKINSSKE